MTDPNDDLPDDLAFMRGLIVAMCLSACFWMAVAASVLLGLRAAGFDVCVWNWVTEF